MKVGVLSETDVWFFVAGAFAVVFSLAFSQGAREWESRLLWWVTGGAFLFGLSSVLFAFTHWKWLIGGMVLGGLIVVVCLLIRELQDWTK